MSSFFCVKRAHNFNIFCLHNTAVTVTFASLIRANTNYCSRAWNSGKNNGDPCARNSGKKKIGSQSTELWVKIENFLCFILYSIFCCCSFATLTPQQLLYGKCARTVFTHELGGCVRNCTSKRSERVRFLIQTNERENAVQSTFPHFVYFLHTEIFCSGIDAFFYFVNEYTYSFGRLSASL